MIPAPVIEEHDGIRVVRDDMLPGGTKIRMLEPYIEAREDIREFVYASPAYGHAQVALAIAARRNARMATIFTAKRKELHELTARAKELNAQIMTVPTGYLTNVQAKARRYCAITGAALIPFGLDDPSMFEYLTRAARALPTPKEVWTAAGSGVLSRALQAAWPDAEFFAVQIGKEPNAGRATIVKAPEAFEADAIAPPPFPSARNYDAKVWQFLKWLEPARKRRVLFWNVGG